MTKYYRQILSGTVVELDPDVDTIPVDAVELTETEVSRHLAPKKTASTFEVSILTTPSGITANRHLPIGSTS